MSFAEHRKQVLDRIEDNSLVISYAGIEIHSNEDAYYNHVINSEFFWMTGLTRPGMALLMTKIGGECSEVLFIDEYNPDTVRWTGKMPTKEEASEKSGIKDVRYNPGLDSAVSRFVSRSRVEHVYFETWKNQMHDLPDYNLVKAREFMAEYPAVKLHDLHELICPLRNIKDAEEIDAMKKAIDLTRQGLEFVMETLKPGMFEYQVQANFEYRCKYLGAKKMAFNTIAGSAINGCMLHYVDNDRVLLDNDLILLDLGAEYETYCSDITRTYPVNGKFTARQKEYYNLVLKANQAVASAAKPGVTLTELNDLTKKILGEGLMEMGKISSVDEVSKYYMHSVSHSIGIDVHDICLGKNTPLEAGWVISNEPGLYVDEEEIGIRIEDDLLITEDGCIVLSKDIIREADEIEAYMAEHRL